MTANGNGTTGEIKIVLDTTDRGDSATGKTSDLTVWLGGNSLGEDSEPTVWLVVEDSKGDDAMHCMFSVSTDRLRRICDMVDAMHKVGEDQWRKALGDQE